MDVGHKVVGVSLPAQFAALTNYPQFIIWKIVPDPNGGKPRKVPIDARSGLNRDPHDPAGWLSFDDAVTAAQQFGYGVGFVLTDGDPFFCVDVDNALIDGQWSTTAQGVFAALPGLAFELSFSGNGFHLWGMYETPVAHSNKRLDLDIELYVTKRFIAITGVNPAGSLQPVQPLYEIAASWFPPGKGAVTNINWVDAAVPEWNGPADDAELINKMLLSRPSMRSLRGEAASFVELWTGAESLGKYYPDGDQNRAFDWSSAELGLCTKLAFWTGKNPARMDRLFRMSALVRNKWLNREYIRRRAIEKGISYCESVLGARNVTAEVGPLTAQPAVVAGAPNAYQFLAPDQQIAHFNGCVYVIDRHQVFTPRGAFLNPAQFKAVYGGYVFAMDAENNDTSRNAFEVLTESRAHRWEPVDSTLFRPEDPAGTRYEESGLRLINSYVPVNTPSCPGDVSPMLGLLEKMIPDTQMRLILIAYMASLVQNPGVKFQWAPCIQGVEGNGKTLLLTAMAMAVGRKYTHYPNADDIGNKFNDWITETLFCPVEEMHQAKNPEITEALKGLITNSVLAVQGKGLKQTTGDNRANFMFCSNRKDALIKSANDRRVCPIFTAQQTQRDIINAGMDGLYFPQLWRWLNTGGAAYWTHYLQTFAIPDELNPAGSCHRAPITSSTAEALEVSTPRAQRIIAEAIAEHRVGFRNGWISSIQLAILFDRVRGPGVSRKDRADAIIALGYALHPNLTNGRSPVRLPSEENARPLIYCTIGSIQTQLTGHAILTAYLKAQTDETLTQTGVSNHGN